MTDLTVEDIERLQANTEDWADRGFGPLSVGPAFIMQLCALAKEALTAREDGGWMESSDAMDILEDGWSSYTTGAYLNEDGNSIVLVHTHGLSSDKDNDIVAQSLGLRPPPPTEQTEGEET